MWVHPKQELVGIDIIGAMKKRLGPDYERWYKVQGKEQDASGYYKPFLSQHVCKSVERLIPDVEPIFLYFPRILDTIHILF